MLFLCPPPKLQTPGKKRNLVRSSFVYWSSAEQREEKRKEKKEPPPSIISSILNAFPPRRPSLHCHSIMSSSDVEMPRLLRRRKKKRNETVHIIVVLQLGTSLSWNLCLKVPHVESQLSYFQHWYESGRLDLRILFSGRLLTMVSSAPPFLFSHFCHSETLI